MSIGFTTILSLCADVTLAIFGSALALLVVWQDARRRSNQYFGLCMAIFALYGAVSCPFKVAQIYDLDPKTLLNLLTTLYIGGLLLLLSFVLAFAGLSRRARWIERMISFPLGTAFIVLAWAGQLYNHFEPLSNGGYRYGVTSLLDVGIVVAGAYGLAVAAMLYRQHTPQARELILPMLALVVGIVVFVGVRTGRSYELNVIAVTLAVVMLGRLVVKYQVFKPLADLNAALEITNLELAEATRMKSQFLANMSHELRTPLNSILGYTDLVVGGTYGGLTDVQRDRLIKVGRNGKRLLDLINDVLDLSKIEAGRLDLRVRQVSTTSLLNGLMNEFDPLARAKNLSLIRGYGSLPALNADEARARQILWNLLSNAIKFTEQGAVIVRGHHDAEHHQVILSVTDTGPGIPPAEQEHIFEAFHQPEDTEFHRHEGTRLGLALTRRLVEMHQGRLWFESRVGSGSTFNVALAAASDQPEVIKVIEPGPKSSGPVILAIDDDREAVDLLQAQLERAGFKVYGVNSALEGLRLVHDLSPALITLDLRMPDLPGEEVLASLHRDPSTAAIPVLVISATDEKQAALAAGASGFITKPVHPQVLLEQIRGLIKQEEVKA